MATITFGRCPIPVFDRFARAYPQHAEGEPATYGPAEEAFEQPFPFDAHFAAYSLPSIERRLGTAGAYAYKPEMVLVVFDVDGPDHKRTPEWDAEIQQKIRALYKARGHGYAYATKGGARIVYGLKNGTRFAITSRADALRWRFSYLDWIEGMRAEFGIIADEHCGDWTRCYRLPRVRRDDVDVTPDWEVGYSHTIAAWEVPLCASDDPRVVTGSASLDSIEIAEPAPVSEEQLEVAAEALIAAWPPRSRHYAGMALCGGLARAGWSEGAIADLVCYVMAKTVGDPELAKWAKQARDAVEKIHRGENVTGFPALETLLCTGTDGQPDESRRAQSKAAIATARRALGQAPAIELFAIALENARAATKPPIAAETAAQALASAVAAGDPLVKNLPNAPRFQELLTEAWTLLGPAFAAATKKPERDASVPVERMFVSAADLFASDLAPPEFLVDNLILADGVSALAGEPKSGKSWDLMYLDVCLTSGRAAFGKHAAKPAGVAHFAVEDTAAACKTRFAAIARGLNLPLDGEWARRLQIQPRGRELDVCSQFDMAVLISSVWFLEEQSPIRLVSFDPLSDVHGAKENDRDGMAIVMAHLRAVQRILSQHANSPVAIVFVHHSGKENADTKGRKRGGQKMRGSSAIHGAIDGGLYSLTVEGDGQTVFTSTMQSEIKAARGAGVFKRTITIEDDERGHALKAVWTVGEVKDDEVPKDLVSERAFAVVMALWKQQGSMTRDELHKKIAGKIDILRDAIDSALKEGWIAQKFVGQKAMGYVVTEAGKALVRDLGTPAGSDA